MSKKFRVFPSKNVFSIFSLLDPRVHQRSHRTIYSSETSAVRDTLSVDQNGPAGLQNEGLHNIFMDC